MRFLLRLFAAVGVLTTAVLVAAIACRERLAEWVIKDALASAEFTNVRVTVTRLSPGCLEISPLEFAVKGQQLKIARIALIREALLARSLGKLQVEGIDARLDLAALSKPAPAGSATAPAEPAGAGAKFDLAALPLENISASGRLQMLFAHAPAPVSLEFQACMAGKTAAAGSGVLTAPGLTAHLKGGYDFKTGRCEFEVTDATADIQPLREFVGGMVSLPLSDWTVAGHLQATARGAYDHNTLSGSAALALRDARLVFPPGKLEASGIEADVQLPDLSKLATADHQRIAIREIKAADLVARDATASIQVASLSEVRIRDCSVSVLGGRVSTEPFQFDPRRTEYTVTLLAEGLRIEQLLEFVPNVPAKASGGVSGRIPCSYGADGLHLGTGWLALQEGVPAEMQLRAEGLLTSNVTPDNPAYPILKNVENGLVSLRVRVLRLDVNPKDGPPGSWATIRVCGEPKDPATRAPELDFSINLHGPIESLINFGLNRNLRVSGGR